MVADPSEFCNLIEDVCGDQKSTTVKVLAAKLLVNLSEQVEGFYALMMTFCMDAITRSLKDQISTNLSFTANAPDDQMTDASNVNEAAAQAQNPETSVSTRVLFSDPDLEQVMQKYNLRFANAEELIEVCLVSITATADFLESQREIHGNFDIFMFKHVEKILQDKSQDVLVRQRASLLCSFTLDMLYQTFLDADERNSGLD